MKRALLSVVLSVICSVLAAPVQAAEARPYFESWPPEELASGFGWSEGPVWIDEGYLLFSDVPGNVVHKWSPGAGAEVFLEPSGYDGPPTEDFREPGINGMIRGPDGVIFAADHGNRAVVSVDLATGAKTILADRFQGHRFNSPNDLVRAANGAIYFTDPPYGLAGIDQSPLKELSFNGVYRLAPDGIVTLLDDSLSFPNGVALSPDDRTLYVTVSDPEHAVWLAYDLGPDGGVANRRVLHDATDRVAAGASGLPDGMCVAGTGEILSTGPGGLYLFADEGAEPVVFDLGSAAANCTFGEDGHSLFVTAHDRLLKARSHLRSIRKDGPVRAK